jgi:hypothetical protein
MVHTCQWQWLVAIMATGTTQYFAPFSEGRKKKRTGTNGHHTSSQICCHWRIACRSVCVRERGGERFSHITSTHRKYIKTHIMNLDWVTFLCFDGAVRRRIRRLDIQLFRLGLLLRRHEQPEHKDRCPP